MVINMIKVKSCAKVNLMLKVIKKRENGYHELQMLNQRIPLFDEIVIESSDEDKIEFVNENISAEFLYKVLKKIKSIYNIEKNYFIKIYKNIPVGAGLGGASMNAATLIDAILDDNNIQETINNKITYFKDLGADIPYGFVDKKAIVEGIGENIYIIEKEITNSLVLVNPNINISTKEVFENNAKYTLKLDHSAIINEDIYENDLEEATFKICPYLKELKEKLSAYGKVVMSGTGSSFIVHTDKYEEIKKEYPDYLVLKVN